MFTWHVTCVPRCCSSTLGTAVLQGWGVGGGAGVYFNTLNAELNPTYHLLALLGDNHIFHVNRIRVNLCLSRRVTSLRAAHSEFRIPVGAVNCYFINYLFFVTTNAHKYSDTSANEDNSFRNHIR